MTTYLCLACGADLGILPRTHCRACADELTRPRGAEPW